jgi:hypothetical protein
MGNVIDLSSANVRREDQLLAIDFRQNGQIPSDYYWTVVYRDYYRADIAETGNDLRFRSHHPWVDSIFRQYDANHQPLPAILIPPPSPIPQTLDSTPTPVGQSLGPPPPPNSPGGSSTPEPSGLVSLGIAAAIAWAAWWRTQRKSDRNEGSGPQSP